MTRAELLKVLPVVIAHAAKSAADVEAIAKGFRDIERILTESFEGLKAGRPITEDDQAKVRAVLARFDININ